MDTTYKDGVLTVFLTGEIDHHSAVKIREETDLQIKKLHPTVLRLNFAGVKFMDSSGIGLIMGRYRAMRMTGGSLEVEDVPNQLKRIVALSGISSLGVIK